MTEGAYHSMQVTDALRKLIQSYDIVFEVSTGSPDDDESFRHGAQMVLADLKSLLNDATDDPTFIIQGRPHIPIGFKLHAVTH